MLTRDGGGARTLRKHSLQDCSLCNLQASFNFYVLLFISLVKSFYSVQYIHDVSFYLYLVITILGTYAVINATESNFL